jgi:hypothetical protein
MHCRTLAVVSLDPRHRQKGSAVELLWVFVAQLVHRAFDRVVLADKPALIGKVVGDGRRAAFEAPLGLDELLARFTAGTDRQLGSWRSGWGRLRCARDAAEPVAARVGKPKPGSRMIQMRCLCILTTCSRRSRALLQRLVSCASIAESPIKKRRKSLDLAYGGIDLPCDGPAGKSPPRRRNAALAAFWISAALRRLRGAGSWS